MPLISVEHLKKYYRVQHKEPGLRGSLKSAFSRQFREVRAVDDISFSVEAGEMVAFIGPNGAGKTTTLKCLSGLLCPTEGRLSVLGFDPWEKEDAFKMQFSFVMGSKNQLWWNLPPMETFTLNKAIYQIPSASFKAILDELVDLLDVEEVLTVQARKLSLGQRRKCELIAALLHQPRLLFLDEPTLGLDVVMQKRIRDFIRQYNQKYQSTVLLTSHYMGDVSDLCSRVIIIDRGRLAFDGNFRELLHQYVDHKLITLTLSREVDPQALFSWGIVKEYQHPIMKIAVSRGDIPQVTGKILGSFPVSDLTIEEPPIEDIVREIFTGHDVA